MANFLGHFEILKFQVKTVLATSFATFENVRTIFIPTSGHTGLVRNPITSRACHLHATNLVFRKFLTQVLIGKLLLLLLLLLVVVVGLQNIQL